VIKRIVAVVALAIALLGFGAPVYATEGSPSPDASASAPAEAPNAAPACAAYTYYGTEVSLCDDFPGAKERSCADVGYRVQLRDKAVDPWDLDGLKGGDRGRVGIGCESYPRKTVTPSAGSSPSPRASSSSSSSAADEPQLPTTGPSGWVFVAVGGGLVLFGLLGYVAVRRRQTRFTA
jgi:LPXTG-motif cell wall-anchored protein